MLVLSLPSRRSPKFPAGVWDYIEVKGCLRDGVGASSGGLLAGSAVPDTDSGALDGVLSAELAHVAGVLCDLNRIVSGRSSQ
jgi:hypothetical protein